MSPWRLAGFEELYELGSGAQGRVVLARRVGTGEMVAIKYLAPALLDDPRHQRCSATRSTCSVRVADPHVARLHEYVETFEGAAIVM
jgi:serine/threonine protein kinase